MVSPAIYVIVRADLTPAQIAVQGIHAGHHSGDQFGAPKNCRVILGTCSDREFEDWKIKISSAGIKSVVFYEPDVDFETAIATEPTTKLKTFRKLKLYTPDG